MALSNEEVLANLVEQRTELTKQLESGQVTLMKIQGAIETLEQIIDPNKEEAPAEPVEEA